MNDEMRIWACGLAVFALSGFCYSQEGGRLPGSEPLLPDAGSLEGQRKQVFDYFNRQIEAVEAGRDQSWRPDFSSVEAYQHSLNDKRAALRGMLGLAEVGGKASLAKLEQIGKSKRFLIERVSIPFSEGLVARGLLFTPTSTGKKPAVIICPDAGVWPERLMGLDGEGEGFSRVSNWLDGKSVVYVQQSIERLADHAYCEKTRGKDRRSILYRLGYVVGRTMPGLDVQDVLAALGFLSHYESVDGGKISVFGHGQGGMTALLSAALDSRISSVVVADYFDQRDRCWAEPVDRRLRGQLLEFGDAELAALIAPRKLTVEASDWFLGGATNFNLEIDRAMRFYQGLSAKEQLVVVKRKIAKVGEPVPLKIDAKKATAVRNQHFEERLSWLRKQVNESEEKRYAHWKIIEEPADKFPAIQKAMLEEYRQMTGELPDDGTPMKVRSELALENEKYSIYRVTIDVRKGVSVYGELMVPQNMVGKRPAVICQHGFGGYPNKITGLGMTEDTAYHEYGRKLAEKGYVVFAPMLLHISPSEEVSRQMRQANAVGMMRLAMPLAKTERVVDFLESLPYVDAERIAYYGLSYGGYSAIWMPPLVDRLALTIISGNFNDWRSKITSDEVNTSYLRHPDEDMYSWNCLNHFTHPELIAMMYPRPVCVEFGRRDGITSPEWTAYAWKQTKALRDHLGQTERVVLTEFDGPHEIHGVETFDFLDRWLVKSEE